ncbi:MAG: hypothetical protein WB795_00730 [Candidatus Acidiferrales bacterium]
MGHFGRFMAVVAATLLLFNTLAVAQSAPAGSPPKENPDAKEVRDFRLTIAKLNRYEVATQGVAKVLHDHPEIKKKMDAGPAASEDQTDKGEHKLDQSVKHVEAFPEIASAVKASGLSVREYVVMTAVLMNSMMMVALKKQGMIQEYPPNISPENAAFLEQNFDRVSRVMEPLMSGMGMGPQDDSKDQK